LVTQDQVGEKSCQSEKDEENGSLCLTKEKTMSYLRAITVLSLCLTPLTASAEDLQGLEKFTEYERAVFDQASSNCTHWYGKDIGVDRKTMLVRLLEIEKELGFPQEARGLLLAAACRESAYNPTAEGDCSRKFVTEKRGDENGQFKTIKRCASKGLVQQAPWWKKRIRKVQKNILNIKPWVRKDARLHWEAAAIAWGEFFMEKLETAKEECSFLPHEWKGKRHKDDYGTRMSRLVAAANAMSTRGMPRCLKYVPSNRSSSGWRCAKRYVRCYERTKHHKELSKWRVAIVKEERDSMQAQATGQ